MAEHLMVFVPLDGYFETQIATWANAVAADVPEMRVVVAESADHALALLPDADAAFGMLTPAMLNVATRLRWLQAIAAAPPPEFFFPELVAHPVVVTNLRGVYRENLANHIMAYVLAFARGLPRYLAQQARAEWHRNLADVGVVDLAATTMLLVGVGEVGALTAARARMFGLRVIGVDSFPERVVAEIDELFHVDELDRLLPDVDWVVLTVPHTPVTEGMMHQGRFASMKQSAFFVNVGRGETVKLDDLAVALSSGAIAGAAIDVSELEPLPPEHPLWTCANLIVTPHVGSFGSDTDIERQRVIVENAQRFVRGQPLRYVIDKTLRY